jgi:1,4-dihydroxy-2-naphthoyl-CoA hydrolase
MAIWHKSYELAPINKQGESSMTGFLDVLITELKENSLTGTMPVTDRTKQPFGLLHGGASCVLAESLGSIASNLVVDPKKYAAVGQSINANHIRSARSGLVTGVCEAVHIGRKSHVWEIKIWDEDQKLVCVSRLTMAIIAK